MKENTAKKEAGWVKWEVLLLLWMAYLLNKGDRQVFNTVLPSIREALGLTDTSVGLIATLFNLFYAFMVPLGGWAGDRFSRKWVVTISILFWSAATMFTGVANSVFMLVLMRSVATGGGEAFFGPANYSLLGMARRTDSRQFRCAAPRRGMEILLHLLRRGRYRLGNTHGVQAQG